MDIPEVSEVELENPSFSVAGPAEYTYPSAAPARSQRTSGWTS